MRPPLDVLAAIHDRRSTRAPFDPTRPVDAAAVEQIVDAARWAPTAHNMQNFELVVVDEPAVLAELAAVEVPVSPTFVRENLRQLSRTAAELEARGRGLLATSFPAAWLDPDATPDQLRAAGPGHLRDSMRGAPLVIVVAFDPRERAPASEHDALGMMSLGCVLENMWLAAQACELGFQVMSTFGGDEVAPRVRRILGLPDELAIAYAIRLGHPCADAAVPRVRRRTDRFVHHNRYHRA